MEMKEALLWCLWTGVHIGACGTSSKPRDIWYQPIFWGLKGAFSYLVLGKKWYRGDC